MFADLHQFINTLQEKTLSPERKSVLQPLIDYINLKIDNNEVVRLNFICTHNSRRSHLSQIWAQTMAHFFNIKNIQCFSGGTEATALFPKVVEVLEKQGFQIQILAKQQNPIFAIKFDENAMPIMGFSKCYDDALNPKSNFCAIMTCSSADEGCPFIAGAEKRIPIRYEDPKIYDGDIDMEIKYLQKSEEIASEMYYVFSNVKNL